MSQFVVGQRFMSETEPELGLGILASVESKIIKISFPASKTDRTYGAKGAPIKRVVFSVGDEISVRGGDKFVVESLQDQNGLVSYNVGQDNIVDERELSDAISFNRPEERIFNASVDVDTLFNLRYKTLQLKNGLLQSSARGFVGGRLALIPHQFYVASQIVDRPIPRVLLADEVGLGKTIEAGLALHHLILSERVKRALIIVPDSLVYQWFVEMLRKFNLSFTTLNQETHLEPGTNPFADNDFVIVNIGLLKGAQAAREMLDRVSWDMVVVDEAHQLKWSTEKVSLEYQIVEKVIQNTKGLLLLTATPEQLGPEGHFARLKLLDPARFFSYTKYLEEMTHYQEVAQKARELYQQQNPEAKKEIDRLQDHHGTGRIFIRNTRARMGAYFSFFPKRKLHQYPLESKKTQFLSLEVQEVLGESFALKADWLCHFLQTYKNEKILLITKSKEKVIALERILKERVASLNVGVFHSGLSFVARDRQAAYFADPEGASILLCTEIGSEGRNFEFAHHLVMFDLPHFPDLLEQRIGRLDRIGQTGDINIHLPYILSSYEEILYRWYHDGLNAFESSAKGASLVHQQLHSLLGDYLQNPKKCFEKPEIIEEFLKTTKSEYESVVKKLEEGRDLLVELNSFDEEKSNELLAKIKIFDHESNLVEYMNNVFQELGVDIEDLSDNIYFIKPSDNMYIPHFPGLNNEGVSITFDRATARKREDIEFLTWDHPMVVGVMDLILSHTFGNATILMRKKTGAAKTFVEAFFKLYAVAPKNLSPERFFPPTSIRVLVDSSGEDFSDKWSKEDIDERSIMADSETIKKARTLPKPAVQKVLKMAHDHALAKANEIKEAYRQNMVDKLTQEKERLMKLKEINPVVRTEEIDALTIQILMLTKNFNNADVILDSVRVIF